MNTAKLAVEQTIPHMIELARSGCKFNAQFLASMAAGYIRAGNPLPPALREWMASALSEGSQGGSVDKALCLKRGRGQGETAHYTKVALAHAVYQKLKDGEARTVEEACQAVARDGARTTKGELLYHSYNYIYKSFYELKYNEL
jgi:hypothetical protein